MSDLGPCSKNDISNYAKVYTYPGGIVDIIASSRPDFHPAGWEAAEDWSRPGRKPPAAQQGEAEPLAEGDKPQRHTDPAAVAERSQRRARAKVRRLALSNEFSYFVTLTLDGSRIDRYSPETVIKLLNTWCNNHVKRDGLQYILVPEWHKDGAIHFHGFFNGALKMVDSGTMKVPGSKKPRRPRSAAQREAWAAAGAQVVYNIPQWSAGFTTAIPLYGDYRAAVAYVCKYIGKEADKPAGRWYYSGGGLAEPDVSYIDLTTAEAMELYGEMAYRVDVPGRSLAIINGWNTEGLNLGENMGGFEGSV